MDKDRITGAATKAKGAFKDALGSATGDTRMQAGGKLDKAKGSVQGAIGRAKDALRGALNRSKT